MNEPSAICPVCEAELLEVNLNPPVPWRWVETKIGLYLQHCDNDPNVPGLEALTVEQVEELQQKIHQV